MRRVGLCAVIFFCCIVYTLAQTNTLVSIVYDFEGMDLGQTDLPEGDYKYGDISSYQVVDNPNSYSGITGYRSLKINLNWSAGYGVFGKGISRFVELDKTTDKFNFYILNPTSNGANALVDIQITEDDNQNGTYETASDDQWIASSTIQESANWQLISIPLNQFTHGNTGGNGIMDIGYNNKGKLLNVELKFKKPTGVSSVSTYFIDLIGFSNGNLPHGEAATERSLKGAEDYCLLGAFGSSSQQSPELVPQEFEGMFPPSWRKIKYVNTFMAFSNNGTTPNYFPGIAYQKILDKGYRPIITWEPYYTTLAPLDPNQPKLTDIISGKFDTYIDQFGDALAKFSDTVIVRPMHEFDGNWYPWCIANNNQDPTLFINAFRHMVDRCRARGATKVKWMFCPNSLPTPFENFNWFVNAYPGDNYVDYVATNIYNHPFPGIPYWRTFRILLTETYYYARKYFPAKPFIICEMASRERDASEPSSSENKAQWIEETDKDLQSFFHETRGLISFNIVKEHDWRLNTTPASLQSYTNNIWGDDYYFIVPVSGIISYEGKRINFFPNPSKGWIRILSGFDELTLYNMEGKKMFVKAATSGPSDFSTFNLPVGIYILRIRTQDETFTEKLVVER